MQNSLKLIKGGSYCGNATASWNSQKLEATELDASPDTLEGKEVRWATASTGLKQRVSPF